MNILFPSFSRSSSLFSTSYSCYSISFCPGKMNENADKGGKIIMPPSALETLTKLNIQYPMLFKLTNRRANRTTHCGVLEFVANEGEIYIPHWMLQNLELTEGGQVSVMYASLPVASFARFQPQCVEFLDISNPKAVLENALRSFACLTVGDLIMINYNKQDHMLKVLETKPEDAVSIIECDMSVDFAPPLGYDAESIAGGQKKEEEMMEEDEVVIPNVNQGFQAFTGAAQRLDGKKKATVGDSNLVQTSTTTTRERGVPNYDYKPGSLTFFRNVRSTAEQKEEENSFKPFGGAGLPLKSTPASSN